MQQIAPIEVHNPKEKEVTESGFGTCLCCGEEAQTHGVCLPCVQADCNVAFGVGCSRNDEVDPCGIGDNDETYSVLKQTSYLK